MVPFGIAIFCDDIREEIGGKISLMGIYGHDMQFLGASFPLLIPKLCINIVARLPADRPVPQMKFLVYFPGDAEDTPTMSMDFSVPEELQRFEPQADKRPPPFPDAETVHVLRQHVVVSSIVIQHEGFIRARMMYGEKRIRLGALKVHSGTPPANHATALPI